MNETELRRLWDQGARRADIAVALGVSLTTVRRKTLDWRRLTPPKNRNRTFDHDAAERLLSYGVPPAEAARALGVSPNALSRAMYNRRTGRAKRHAAWIASGEDGVK